MSDESTTRPMGVWSRMAGWRMRPMAVLGEHVSRPSPSAAIAAVAATAVTVLQFVGGYEQSPSESSLVAPGQ